MQNESCAQIKQMTAVGHISDMGEIVQASWTNFQHDGAAAFQLSERSPLPPAWFANDLPGEHTPVFNVHWIRTIDRHPAGCDLDSAPDSISDTENWLDWNGALDIPNESEED